MNVERYSSVRSNMYTKNMKNNTTNKIFVYIIFSSVVLMIYKLFIDTKYINYEEGGKVILTSQFNDADGNNNSNMSLIYILQWTSSKNIPFVYMGVGQHGFISRNCTFTNCYVTDNRTYLGDYTKFDAIVFAAPEARFLHTYGYRYQLPLRRSSHQKFVLSSIESADNYPVCTNRFDGYYNWTWSYKLDSDVIWGYIAIRDMRKKIIGPKRDMHWIKIGDMAPVSDLTKKILRNKRRAAAWFVSNCYTRSKREHFAQQLKVRLSKYNLTIDAFGECNDKVCPREGVECQKLIRNDYYFYLALENSFAEDYVTEKILHGLNNYAIPIVYGGANYTRFMPDGIYLNANELGPARLAKKMNELINNPELYAEYFKWRNHYTYHYRSESVETDDYCGFCTMLNKENEVKRTTIYKHFRHWWDPPNRCTDVV